MLDFLLQNPYPFIFVGLLIGGESVLFPSVFLAIEGVISFPGLIFVAALATIISDSAWYALGRFVSFSFLKRPWLKKTLDKAQSLAAVFDRHGYRILYFSKFIYGTRTAVQILSGMHKMPFVRYITVNTFGVLSLLFLVIIVGVLTGKGVESLSSIFHRFSIFVAVGMTAVVLIHLWLKRALKKWFPS